MFYRFLPILILSSGLLDQALLAGEIPRTYRSGYYLGRGDTGIATADNHDAIFYNPAGLAQGTGIYKETVLISPLIEVSADTKDLARQIAVEKKSDPDTLLSHEGKNQHVGFSNFTGIVLRRAAIGAFASSQTNLLVRKDQENAGFHLVDASSAANQGAVFGLAESLFSGALMIGVTGKYLRTQTAAIEVSLADAEAAEEQLDDEENIKSNQGGGADVGLIYKFGKLTPFSFGFTAENVGDMKLAPTEAGGTKRVIPQILNVGIAAEPGTKFSKFKLMADYRDLSNAQKITPYKRLHLGAEISVRDLVGLTGGINQGYPTMGLFVNLYFFRMDVGAYTEEVGSRAGARPDRRYFMQICAGF